MQIPEAACHAAFFEARDSILGLSLGGFVLLTEDMPFLLYTMYSYMGPAGHGIPLAGPRIAAPRPPQMLPDFISIKPGSPLGCNYETSRVNGKPDSHCIFGGKGSNQL